VRVLKVHKVAENIQSLEEKQNKIGSSTLLDHQVIEEKDGVERNSFLVKLLSVI